MSMPLSKKCSELRALCYTGGALETFLPANARRGRRRLSAGCVSGAFPEKMKRWFCHLVFGLATAAVVLSGATPARGEIISYIDENGRRVFINLEESGPKPRIKSSAAGLRLVARRRAQMPDIDEHIELVARQHGVEPRLVYAIIEVESSWDPWAVSRRGAVGLMQLLPETGQRFGGQNLVNPKENVAAGVRYLRFLFDRFRNNTQLSLAAYNAGENIVAELGRIPPYPETREYVQRVLAIYNGGGGPYASRNYRTATRAGVGRIYQEFDENGRIVFANH